MMRVEKEKPAGSCRRVFLFYARRGAQVAAAELRKGGL
jgi:hypothetical protein